MDGLSCDLGRWGWKESENKYKIGRNLQGYFVWHMVIQKFWFNTTFALSCGVVLALDTYILQYHNRSVCPWW